MEQDRLTLDDILERIDKQSRGFKPRLRRLMWNLTLRSNLYCRIMSLPLLRRWEIVDSLGNFRCEYLIENK